MRHKTGPLIRTEEGMWKADNNKAQLTQYQSYFLGYLNSLDKIFNLAKVKCEFNFIFTLLGIRRLQPVKWKSFETLQDIEEIFEEVNHKFGTWKGTNTHTGLFRYGLIVESDEMYSFMLNILRCINDEPPQVQPFAPKIIIDADGKETKIFITPSDKIARIKKLAKKVKLDFNFFDDFYDNKLRNAVFHSSYHFDAYDGTLTIIGDSAIDRDGKIEEVPNPDTVYSHSQMLKTFNGAFAFFKALMILINTYKLSYEGDEIIKGSHNFLGYTFKTITKEQEGLIGIVEVDGPINVPFEGRALMGTFNPDHVTTIKKDDYRLHLSANEQAQKRIDKFPRKFQKYIARYYKKKLGY